MGSQVTTSDMGDTETVHSVRGKGWVKFEDEGDDVSTSTASTRRMSSTEDSPGSIEVTDSHSVDVETLRKKSLDASRTNSMGGSTSSVVSLTDVVHPVVGSAAAVTTSPSPRHKPQQFENGDIIVTLLPVNEKLPWISPAKFRPELVPEELMAPVLTLTVEDYVQTLEKLTSDMRFTIYIMGYKRILVIWIVLAFVILLSLLFSGFQGIELFACGVVWLILNAGAIFFCMWIKIKLNKQMEKCMAVVNNSLIKHKLLLGVDDRGKISCHKVNLCFIYFDPSDCIKRLETVLAEKPEENGGFNREEYLREV